MTEDELTKKLRVVERAVVPPRIQTLRDYGITAEPIDRFTFMVGNGRFVLNAAIGHWRSADGSMSGYTIESLKQAYEVALLSDVADHLAQPAPQKQITSERGEAFAQRFLQIECPPDPVAPDQQDTEVVTGRDIVQASSDPDRAAERSQPQNDESVTASSSSTPLPPAPEWGS